jgi:hypothetical protein
MERLRPLTAANRGNFARNTHRAQRNPEPPRVLPTAHFAKRHPMDVRAFPQIRLCRATEAARKRPIMPSNQTLNAPTSVEPIVSFVSSVVWSE